MTHMWHTFEKKESSFKEKFLMKKMDKKNSTWSLLYLSEQPHSNQEAQISY